MGKTTLLTHIAARKLAIPPNIDVLLCEQGKWVKLLFFTLWEKNIENCIILHTGILYFLRCGSYWVTCIWCGVEGWQEETWVTGRGLLHFYYIVDLFDWTPKVLSKCLGLDRRCFFEGGCLHCIRGLVLIKFSPFLASSKFILQQNN